MKKFLSADLAMAFLAAKSQHDDSAENTARYFIEAFAKAFESMTYSKNGLTTVKLRPKHWVDTIVIRFHNTRFQHSAYQAQFNITSQASSLRGYFDFEYDWPNVHEVLKVFSKM